MTNINKEEVTVYIKNKMMGYKVLGIIDNKKQRTYEIKLERSFFIFPKFYKIERSALIAILKEL